MMAIEKWNHEDPFEKCRKSKNDTGESKMKAVRNIALALLAVALASCGSVEPATGSADLNAATKGAADPVVKLCAARAAITSPAFSGTHTGWVSGDIELENKAYTKTVQIHYTTGNKVWKDANAYYVKSIGNNREIWRFKEQLGVYSQGGDPRSGFSGPGWNVQFAVKYVVNGVTYWDNNSSADYRCSTEGSGAFYGRAAFGKQNVVLLASTFSDYPYTQFRGSVATKDLGTAAKAVKIVYSTDNWATTKVLGTNAVYSSGAKGGVTTWSFYEPASPQMNMTYQFAVSYEYNGATYWDNNGSQNYTVTGGVNAPF